MKKFRRIVTVTIEVELDETKFTPEFYAEYTANFSPYNTLEDHADHIAWMQATGVEDMSGRRNPFVEGYGPAKDMGISAREVCTEVEPE